MTLNRLMWVFGGLFVVFGLLMAVTNGTTVRDILGGLSLISLGGFAFAMVFDGVSKGEIRLQFNDIKRATQPRLFWAAVALVGAAGTGVLASAAWVLFLK